MQLQLHQQRTNSMLMHKHMRATSLRKTKNKQHEYFQKDIKCEIIQCNNARRVHISSSAASHTHTYNRTQVHRAKYTIKPNGRSLITLK